MMNNAWKSFLKKGLLLGATIGMIFSANVVGASEDPAAGGSQIEEPAGPQDGPGTEGPAEEPAAPAEDDTLKELELKAWQKNKVVLKSVKNVYGGVQVTWQPLEGAEIYNVYGKKPGGKWKLLKQIKAGNKCAFKFADVISGNDYIFTVRAEKSGVRGAYDPQGLRITYLKTVKPKRPKNKAEGLEISWAQVNGATSYFVYRRTANGSWEKIGKTKKVSFIDKNAKNGTKYFYAVRAYNGSVRSYYKESPVGCRVAQVTIASYDAVSQKAYNFKWKKNARVTGYELGYKTTSGNMTTINIKGAATVSKKISGFQQGMQYNVYIRGYITSGDRTYYSAWSPALSIVNSWQLEKDIRSIMSRYPATWSVYVKDLSTNQVVNINELQMYPASVIKIAIMAGTFDQIKKGNVSYDANIKSLLWNMVTLSNNECANRLVYACGNGNWNLGVKRINDFLHENGMTKTFVHHALMPASTSGSDGKGSNLFTARDTVTLMEKVYRNQLVDKWSSKEMMNLLLNQQVRNNIIRSIPAGIKIASKSGDAYNNHNDVAIIWGPKTTYIISIFSDQQSYAGTDGIRVISQYVYNYLNK